MRRRRSPARVDAVDVGAMAVVLPYIAVVFANAVHPRAVGVVTPVLPTTYAVPSIAPTILARTDPVSPPMADIGRSG